MIFEEKINELEDMKLNLDSFENRELSVILYDENIHGENVYSLPSGTYLTMYLDESSFDNRKYYNEMIRFAQDNNIKIVGDFIETGIIARVNKDGKGNNLSKIELLCR